MVVRRLSFSALSGGTIFLTTDLGGHTMSTKFSIKDHSIRFAHGGLLAACSLHARSLSRKLWPRQQQAVTEVSN